ncbi:hypothetical protein [Caballeronia sp. 15711]|uniref:hypothetical protein n=1 Tax=Caballeronia sp. 15711 TaxID=3391029 RepID=UPI0039E6A764
MRSCFSGSALEAFDVQIYSFVIPALAAAGNDQGAGKLLEDGRAVSPHWALCRRAC